MLAGDSAAAGNQHPYARILPELSHLPERQVVAFIVHGDVLVGGAGIDVVPATAAGMACSLPWVAWQCTTRYI